MAGTTDSVKTTLSVIATTSNKLKDLIIKDGQLIFMYDVGRIAFDYKGKRNLYNQIIELESELERVNVTNPVNGKYYFVIETGILWRYSNGWHSITATSEETIFIGNELPALGVEKKLYVDKTNKNISVWDAVGNNYMVVANKTDEVKTIANSDIDSLFL